MTYSSNNSSDETQSRSDNLAVARVLITINHPLVSVSTHNKVSRVHFHKLFVSQQQDDSRYHKVYIRSALNTDRKEAAIHCEVFSDNRRRVGLGNVGGDGAFLVCF